MKINVSYLKRISKKNTDKILTTFFSCTCAILLCGAGWGDVVPAGPDCGKCPQIQEEMRVLKKQAEDGAAELQRQRNIIKALSPDQDSQRMRLTSQLFVIAAKSETAENRMEAKEKDRQFHCQACGKKN